MAAGHSGWVEMGFQKRAMSFPQATPAGAVAAPPPPGQEPDRRAAGADALAALPPGRLVSLDVFRGATIAAMLLVNNPGSWSHVYAPLRHAEWHGWTPTDLIFPFFLFIVGVAMVFSIGRRLEAGTDRGSLLAKATRRAAILFMLGLILHGFPAYDLSGIRIPGVLQRIAVAYLAATVLMVTLRTRGLAIALAAILVGYWAIMALVPVPGVGAGLLTPDDNPAAWLDRALLGEAHLWAYSRTWDPEGILSTVPAIGTVLMGILAGTALRRARSQDEGTAHLFLLGAGAVALGWAWDPLFPINKNLWTSSYVLFTGGIALQALALCYWVVDVRGRKRWATPFVVFGVNAIAAFFLSSLAARALNLVQVPFAEVSVPLKAWIYERGFASWAGPLNGSLTFAIAYVTLWLGGMWLLYRRGIFIKV